MANIRKFLTSVADVYGYDESDNIVFTGKTLLDSSIETTLGSAPVRGGRGNQLLYVYYHTGEMKINLTDTQWNLAFLGATVGSTVATSNNVYKEETIALTNSTTFTITGTPLAWAGGAVIYGWVTLKGGNTVRCTFSGSVGTFSDPLSAAATSDVVCVRYYALNAASTSITIKANMIPKVVKLVMEAQLNSADVSTNKIGIVQIIAPTVTLSGAFSIAMKSDGVSNTPLSAMALAYTEPSATGTGCAVEPYYAKLIEIIDNVNWYDNVYALSVAGGDFTMGNSTTSTLAVWALPATGAAFKPPVADLTFALVGVPTATGTTVGANTGIVTSDSTDGTATINVKITAKATIDSTVIVTVA
jgi:hypothetical protein